MDASVCMAIVSYTLVKSDLMCLTRLKCVLMLKSLHTLWIVSLNPATYGIVRIKPIVGSVSVLSLEGNSLEPALICRCFSSFFKFYSY